MKTYSRRRDRLTAIAAVLLAFGSAPNLEAARPNVVLIVCDDLT